MRGLVLAGAALLTLSGCATGRIENGVFVSPKGYRVSLPREGWTVKADGKADLELRRTAPPGGMLADATCSGRELTRSPEVLARHLTFGLSKRETLRDGAETLAGWPAVHTVVRGTAAGTDVLVEAVVIKGRRCIYDFLYVAPASHFEAGRAEFRALVESFSGETP